MTGKRLRKIIQQLILMFYTLKKMDICPAYISNINSDCEKQIILLMIPNEEKESGHYLAIKKLSVLLNEIISKYDGLNCLHSFRTENKLVS